MARHPIWALSSRHNTSLDTLQNSRLDECSYDLFALSHARWKRLTAVVAPFLVHLYIVTAPKDLKGSLTQVDARKRHKAQAKGIKGRNGMGNKGKCLTRKGRRFRRKWAAKKGLCRQFATDI